MVKDLFNLPDTLAAVAFVAIAFVVVAFAAVAFVSVNDCLSFLEIGVFNAGTDFLLFFDFFFGLVEGKRSL